MRWYAGIGASCGLAALGCLVAAFGLRGEWQVLYAVPAGAVLWMLAGRRLFQAASGLLLLYVALAVVGMMRDASALLLSTGCILALAAWDLSDDGAAAVGAVQRGKLDEPTKQRLLSLSAVAAASMLLAAIASLVRLRLPFGMVALIALVAMGSLLYAVRRVRDRFGQD